MMPFEEFQLFRKILCVCPCCGELHRVSDLNIKSKARIEKTWLDYYEAKKPKLTEKEEEFEQNKKDLREKSNEKGRILAKKVFNDFICTSIRIMKLDPYDIKPILNPIDYVVFKDMKMKKRLIT